MDAVTHGQLNRDMKRVVIVQPYLPVYRIPMFSALQETLVADGIELCVVTGHAQGDQAKRGDSRTGMPWQIETRTHSVSLGGHWLRTYRSWGWWHEADALVVELAVGAIDTYIASIRGPAPFAVWGHVSVPSNRAARAALTWQLRRAACTFAYTASGASRARDLGACGPVFAVGNSVETDSLALRVEEARTRTAQGRAVPHFSYIGGLDESKRIDFLAEVLDELWQIDPSVRLTVAGEGNQRNLLLAAESRGQVELVGHASTELKAEILARSRAILCPGRVGLIAVESLATKTPIVTVKTSDHAPEYEYLQPGSDSIATRNSVTEYARTIADLAHNDERLKRLVIGCGSNQPPNLADAVSALRRGIMLMLQGGTDRERRHCRPDGVQ